MAKTVDQLVIEIKAETAELRKGLNNVNKSLDKTSTKSRTVINSFKSLGKMFAIIGGALAVKGIVNTARSFEDLEATLRAVTSSTENAALAMKTVTNFTKTTPFQLKNVTESFIRFYQAGIEPTEENLKAFGNLAAGMGKDISDLARATFNATTGEMDTLKQFGIKAKQMGDEVTFIFEGQETTVKKTSENIAGYIMELGATRFPTAIEERLNTLSGAASNLQDNISIASDSIGKAGLTEALTTLTKQLSEGVAGTTGFTEGLGKLGGQLVNLIGFILQGASVLGHFIDHVMKGAKDMIDILQIAFQGFVIFLKKSFNAFILPLELMVRAVQAAYNALPFIDDVKPVNFRLDTSDASQKISDLWNNVKSRRMKLPVPDKDVVDDAAGSIAPPRSTESATDGLISMKEAFTDMQPAIIETTNAFANDFVGALLDGENAMDSFKNFAKDMVSQIIAAFMQMMVIKPIMDAIFKGFGLDVTPSAVDTSAGGGTVQPRKPVIVGERGAEVFIPNTGGTIMNNMNSRNMGGGTPVIVNQSVNFSTGVVPTVRAEVQKMMPMISDVTKGAVLEAAMRGGSFRKGLQGGG